MVGTEIGELTVIAFDKVKKQSMRYWLCQCSCGAVKSVYESNLKAGLTKSCGHIRGGKTTHGMSRTLVYHVWHSMIQRCTNPNHVAWKHYGGRGITVCEDWKQFDQFYKDMGPRPAGLSIERIDNDKGYNKDNCKWATAEEQSYNRRLTRGKGRSV